MKDGEIDGFAAVHFCTHVLVPDGRQSFLSRLSACHWNLIDINGNVRIKHFHHIDHLWHDNDDNSTPYAENLGANVATVTAELPVMHHSLFLPEVFGFTESLRLTASVNIVSNSPNLLHVILVHHSFDGKSAMSRQTNTYSQVVDWQTCGLVMSPQCLVEDLEYTIALKCDLK